MPDIVLLRSENHFLRKTMTTAIVSTAGNVPEIPLHAPLAQVLQLLLNSGFTLASTSADTAGAFYTLIRTTSAPPGTVEYFRERVGETLTIETTAGAVSGTIIFVGSDVIQLREPNGDIVLIPLTSVVAVF